MELGFQGNPLEVDEAISRVKKAISSTDVSGLLLVREDLQAEMAIAAPLDTPIRNRLNRLPGNGSAHSWYQLQASAGDCGKFLGTTPSNGFFARGGIPSATQANYKYMSAPYVSLGDVVEVPFFDQMAGLSRAGGYGDITVESSKFRGTLIETILSQALKNILRKVQRLDTGYQVIRNLIQDYLKLCLQVFIKEQKKILVGV